MKLTSKDRTKINDQIFDLCKGRLPSIPLMDINNLLVPHGWTMEEALFLGRHGTANVELVDDKGKECENSYLVISWLKGDNDGKWEVVAYLS